MKLLGMSLFTLILSLVFVSVAEAKEPFSLDRGTAGGTAGGDGFEASPFASSRLNALSFEQSPGPWLELGKRLFEQGRYEQAHECYLKALPGDEENSELLLEMGVVLSKMGRFEGALARFLSVLLLEPDNTMARFNAAQAYLRLGRAEKAVEHLKKVIEEESDDWMALEKIIQAYSSLEAEEELAAYREKLFELHGEGKVSLNYYCREVIEQEPFRVLVYEYFPREEPGPRPVFYSFMVYLQKNRRYLERFRLASFETMNEMAIKSGRLDEGERLYILERIYRGSDGKPKRKHVMSWDEKVEYEKLRLVVEKQLKAMLEEGR